MRAAFFAASSHFCALPETNAHFPVTQCRTQSLLFFSSSAAPSSCPKVSHRMNVPFSFSRDDDDQMIAGKEFQTIPRHSGRGAATVWAGCPSALRLFWCGNIWNSSAFTILKFLILKSIMEHSLLWKIISYTPFKVSSWGQILVPQWQLCTSPWCLEGTGAKVYHRLRPRKEYLVGTQIESNTHSMVYKGHRELSSMAVPW